MATNYQWVTVQGVKCIVLTASSEGLSHREKRVLKKLKNKLGEDNLDTPILDTKQCGPHREYCDIILYTNNVEKWEKSLTKAFITCRQITKKLPAGNYQIIVSNEADSGTLFTACIYPTSKKIMIQPGMCEEGNLLRVLKKIPDMLSNTESRESDSYKGDMSIMNTLPP